MDYNFSSISADAVTTLEKRLLKIKESVLDDVSNFVRVLNNPITAKKCDEVKPVVIDIMNDQIGKIVLEFTNCMNKVQKLLADNL